MTTTSTYQGMDSGKNPSSRVLRPPGGGSSNIFGGPDDYGSETKPQARGKPQDSNIFGSGDTAATENGKPAQQQPVQYETPAQRSFKPKRQEEAPFARFADDDSSAPFDRHAGTQSEGDFKRHDVAAYHQAQLNNMSVKNHRARGFSSHNPITGEAYPGHENDPLAAYSPTKRQLRGNQGAYNPITGEPYEEEEQKKKEQMEDPEVKKEEAAKKEEITSTSPVSNVHTSSRVLQPPGGATTTKLW